MQVTEIQRSRMLAAAVEAVEEVGYARMTVAQVIGRARVSRKTFYDVFADREDCFVAAFDQAVAHGRAVVREAYARESGWLEGIRSGLARLLMLLDDEPALAKVCVVEALAAGPKVLEHRARVLEQAAAVIDRGRSLAGTSAELPEVTAEGVVGAIFAVVHTRLLEPGGQPLDDLRGPADEHDRAALPRRTRRRALSCADRASTLSGIGCGPHRGEAETRSMA